MDTAFTLRRPDSAVRRRSLGLDCAPASAYSEMHQPGNIAVALALAEGGLSIFPASGSVVPTGEGPGRISKAPLVSAWREKSTTDLDQIRRWWRKWPDALPAIDCGKSGLLVVDPDRRSGADGLSAWRDLVRKEGGLPEGVLTVETANGGRHVYFRAEIPRGNSAGSLPTGIDVRSDGGYVIGPGATVEDGRRWNAQDGLSAFIAAFERGRLSTPPDWLKKRLARKREERTKASFNEPAFPSLSELRKAVEAIPNDEDFDSREEWRNVVAAIKHESLLHGEEDEGFILARKWSAEWDNSDAADAHFCETWDSLKRGNSPNARTGKSLLRLASRHGYRLPSPDRKFEDERQREVDGNVVERRKGKSFRSQMQIIDIVVAASLALTKSRKPLIDGLFDEGAMSVAYGPSNVGKTFIVLDLAWAVATGLPWNGMATTRGFVVYVAAEGGFGVNQRLLALLQRYKREVNGDATKPLFGLVKHPIDLRTDGADVDELCALIENEEKVRGFKCAWVIVDTLSRAMAGGDENSSVDMGRIVKAADRIRERTGAHFTFVHHTGKDVAKGARGHSCLRAATDTELEISNGSLTVEKQRDMSILKPLAFSLMPVELGDDPNGRPVTSAIVEWTEATSLRPASKLDKGEAAFVLAVENALDDYGSDRTFDGRQVRAVDGEKVREKFYASYSAESTGSAKRSAFNRNKRSKAVATIVSSHDDGLACWYYLNLDYVGFEIKDERDAQEKTEAFGKRSGGQRQAADRNRAPADLYARRSRRSQPFMTAATASRT